MREKINRYLSMLLALMMAFDCLPINLAMTTAEDLLDADESLAVVELIGDTTEAELSIEVPAPVEAEPLPEVESQPEAEAAAVEAQPEAETSEATVEIVDAVIESDEDDVVIIETISEEATTEEVSEEATTEEVSEEATTEEATEEATTEEATEEATTEEATTEEATEEATTEEVTEEATTEEVTEEATTEEATEEATTEEATEETNPEDTNDITTEETGDDTTQESAGETQPDAENDGVKAEDQPADKAVSEEFLPYYILVYDTVSVYPDEEMQEEPKRIVADILYVAAPKKEKDKKTAHHQDEVDALYIKYAVKVNGAYVCEDGYIGDYGYKTVVEFNERTIHMDGEMLPVVTYAQEESVVVPDEDIEISIDPVEGDEIVIVPVAPEAGDATVTPPAEDEPAAAPEAGDATVTPPAEDEPAAAPEAGDETVTTPTEDEPAAAPEAGDETVTTPAEDEPAAAPEAGDETVTTPAEDEPAAAPEAGDETVTTPTDIEETTAKPEKADKPTQNGEPATAPDQDDAPADAPADTDDTVTTPADQEEDDVLVDLLGSLGDEELIVMMFADPDTTFSISVALKFNDDDWAKVLRPTNFKEEIQLVAYEVGENGELVKDEFGEPVVVNTLQAQMDDPAQDCYIGIFRENDGSGSFKINNIPKTINDKEVAYEVVIPCEDSAKHYEVTDGENTLYAPNGTKSGTVTLSPKMVELTLKTDVDDPADTTAFTMSVKLYSPEETATAAPSMDFSLGDPVGTNGKTISLPEGLRYEIKETVKDGYVLDEITIETELVDEDGKPVVDADGNPVKTSKSFENPATGTVSSNEKVTITAHNKSYKAQYELDLVWCDNNNVDRPKLPTNADKLSAYFTLQYYGVKLDAYGNPVVRLDENGDPVTEKDADGNPVLDGDGNPVFVYEYDWQPYNDTNTRFDVKGDDYAYTNLCYANQYRVAVDEAALRAAYPGLEDYVITVEHNEQGKVTKVSFVKKTTFEADLKWLDDSDVKGYRPKDEDLDEMLKDMHLYRSNNGSVFQDQQIDLTEKITDPDTGELKYKYITINADGSVHVSVPEMEMYDQTNTEYDYVLVQGEIGDRKSTLETGAGKDNYKIFYTNNGHYGSDRIRCHNGGTITYRLDGTTDMKAQKVWADTSDDKNDRPDATVTLWRYVKTSIPADAENKENLILENAAQVIYYETKVIPDKYVDKLDADGNPVKDADGNTVQEPATYKTVVNEILLSYTLDTPKNTDVNSVDIVFNSNTVNGLPPGFSLPKYDESGREYVYFVRETVDSSKYATTYLDDGQSAEHTFGALDKGTVKNTRIEKVAVNVEKQWKAPSALKDVDGTEVQMKVMVKDKDGKDKILTVMNPLAYTYDMLSVQEAAAQQTIGGFTTNITTLDKTFYVNMRDENGEPYKMSEAKIVEISVVKKDSEGNVTSEYTVVENDADHTSLITVPGSDGTQFIANSNYIGNIPKNQSSDGLAQYNYSLTNTVTGTREYKLTKVWHDSLFDSTNPLNTDFIEAWNNGKITWVDFTIERQSTRNANASWEPYADPSWTDGCYRVNVVKDENGKAEKTWIDKIELPKYDNDGYEYRYRATEVSYGKAVDGFTFDKNHVHLDDGTKVTNYRSGQGDRYFNLYKNWYDNGDLHQRKEVYVRMYLKKDIAELLADKSGTITNLDELGSSIPYYTADIKKENEWYSEQSLGLTTISAKRGIAYSLQNGRTDDYKVNNVSELLILEYKVGRGDDAGYVSYKLEDLYDAAKQPNSYTSYTVNGTLTVSSTKRQYEVVNKWEHPGLNTEDAEKRSSFYFTNRRTGDVDITIKKIWKDDNNRDNKRFANVQFQLLRNGVPYKPTTEEADLLEDLVYTNNGATDGGDGLNKSTGIVTLTQKGNETSGNGNTWTATISNIPMYNSDGIPYAYSVTEITKSDDPDVTGFMLLDDDEGYFVMPMDTDGGNGSGNGNAVIEGYISKRVGLTAVQNTKEGAAPESVIYTYTYENTLQGMTEHTAYKVWKDAEAQGDSRPDLYITVYRYLLKDAEEKAALSPNELIEARIARVIELDTDLQWQEKPSSSADNNEPQNYNWKITANNLLKYDGDGNKYGYFFAEKMNNNGVTVWGQYVQSTDYTAAGEEVFTNTLTDTLTLESKKVWDINTKYDAGSMNVEALMEKIGKIMICLYRTTDPDLSLDDVTDDGITELLQANKIMLVDQQELAPNNIIRFPNGTPGTDNYVYDEKTGTFALPRYDAEGNAYHYLLYEKIPTGTNSVAAQLYVRRTLTGQLVNVFRDDVNRRSVQVTKTWNRQEPYHKGKYPSVTYTLYRTIDGAPDKAVYTVHLVPEYFEEAKKYPNTDGRLIELKLTSTDPSTGGDDPEDPDADGSKPNGSDPDENDDISVYVCDGKVVVKFNDLLVYSPYGELYHYYVTEADINGYTITHEDENSSNGDSHADIYTSDEDKAAVFVKDGKIVDKIGTTNKYPADTRINLVGYKLWDDYMNVMGYRPGSITLKLYRYANVEKYEEVSQGNYVAEEPVTPLAVMNEADPNVKTPYVVWEKGEDSDTARYWKYTIYNLEQYAPNGQPYIYKITEEKVEKYSSPSTVTKVLISDKYKNGTTVPVNTLTNKFDGKYTVIKRWVDGDDRYNLRPNNVTMVLQRSTDGIAWQNIKVDEDAHHYDYVNDITDGTTKVGTVNGLPVVSVKINADGISFGKDGTLTDVIGVQLGKNNAANVSTWQYQFNNLPVYADDETKWQYRAVEVKIGEDYLDNVYEAGSYRLEYNDQSATKTDAANWLKNTEMRVKKTWRGDNANMYFSRPESISFTLQKRGSVKIDDVEYYTAWENVTITKGDDLADYEFTLTPANINADEWSMTLTNLPSVLKYTDVPLYVIKNNSLNKAMDDDGNQKTHTGYMTAQYRALEHTVENSEILGVDGAMNYDPVNYNSENAHEVANGADNESKISTSNISNELYSDSKITVKKVWRTNRPDVSNVTATFELQYCIAEMYTAPDSSSNTPVWIPVGEGEEEWKSFRESGTKIAEDVEKTLEASKNPVKFTWDNLPTYDRQGNKLGYRVVEQAVDGFTWVLSQSSTTEDGKTDYSYSFTNIEKQAYTVTKIWDREDYAQTGADGKLTAAFVLRRKVGNGDWADVPTKAEPGAEKDAPVYIYNNIADPSAEHQVQDEWVLDNARIKQSKEVTLTSDSGENTTFTWYNLPMYTEAGETIQYRAVETKINGIPVEENDAYRVSYLYGNGKDLDDEESFGDTDTQATNRMVYGFVNLTKTGAYLDADGKVQSNAIAMKDVTFDIYRITKNENGTENKTPYVSDVKTDDEGNLINTNGKYGTGENVRYLISGEYLMIEAETQVDYSKWDTITYSQWPGIRFTVGTAENTTGEHGTAWVTVDNMQDTESGKTKLEAGVTYLAANPAGTDTSTPITHTKGDACAPQQQTTKAYNVESRGVVSFVKVGAQKAGDTYNELETQGNAEGKSNAYFGVYVGETLVAGMVAKDADHLDKMVLTDKDQTGTVIAAAYNTAGVPYMRNSNGLVTLLTGKYTVKELVPPPGYKLDTTVRYITIPKVETTSIGANQDELKLIYKNNQGLIAGEANGSGVDDYKWSNTPNQVKIYKLDQYGRQVQLKENGYLTLTVQGAGNTFLNGESTIKLYQKVDAPSDVEAGVFADGKTNITYTAGNQGYWTIVGLFDASLVYELAENADSVPDDNVLAKSIYFKVTADGSMVLMTKDSEGNFAPAADGKDAYTEPKSTPTAAQGDDYNNYYKSDAAGNEVVLRDVARYHDAALVKYDRSKTRNDVIQYISFKLYKKTGVDIAGEAVWTSVLLENAVVTTDQDGKIVLSETNLMNQITGKDLKYGLDDGEYKFEEQEKGASDCYKLADIYFTISPKEDAMATDPYADQAVVTYYDPVEIGNDGTTGYAPNTPVHLPLQLTKQDKDDETKKLAGGKFVLEYTSITNGDAGSQTSGTTPIYIYGITNAQGMLVETDDQYAPKKDADGKEILVDVGRKGTYVLKETQAPDYYMTPTYANGEPAVLLTFEVDSDNQVSDITDTNKLGLASAVAQADENGLHTQLNATVKNEKTVVYIDKLNDIIDSTKTSDQTTLGGESLTGAKLQIVDADDYVLFTWDATGENSRIGPVPVVTEANGENQVPSNGVLKENTTYTLKEITTPDGYLKANDISFMLYGTTTLKGENVSVLKVWDSATSAWVTTNVSDTTKAVTMVDEAVIAPVTLHKTVGDDKTNLPGAIFDVSYKLGNKTTKLELGTAITNADGDLEWQTLESDAVAKGLIFTADGKRINNVNDVVGENANHLIVLRKIDNALQGSYVFTETYAPDHAYNEGKSFYAKVTDADYAAYKNDPSYRVGVTENNAAVDPVENPVVNPVVNPAFTATFKLYKYDAEYPNLNNEKSNGRMDGVTFTLTRTHDANGQALEPVEPTTWTTEGGGLLTIDLTKKGTYELRETETLTGYKIDNTKNIITFKVVDDDQNKTLTYDASNTIKDKHTKYITAPAAAQNKPYDMPNDRNHGTVTLYKQDKDSKQYLDNVAYKLERVAPGTDGCLYPATVTVVDESGDPVTLLTGKKYTVESQTETSITVKLTGASGETGKLYIDNLQWGNYTLTETQELDGFVLNSEPIDFNILPTDLNATVGDTTNVVPNYKNRLTINKVSTENENTTLQGATFVLWRVETEEVADSEGTTTKVKKTNRTPVKYYTTADAITAAGEVITAGETTIYGLTKGEYVLHETKAPDGYELTDDIVFIMLQNGQISTMKTCTVEATDEVKTKETLDNGILIPGLVDGLALYKMKVTNRPIEVKLAKELSDEDDTLEGRGDAEYQLTGVFANETVPTTRPLTGNTIDTALKAQLIGGNEYTLTEIKAPNGYKVQAESVILVVGTDGQVTEKKTKPFFAADNDNNDGVAYLTFTDDPMYLELEKYQKGTNTQLDGAEFTITGRMYDKTTKTVGNTTLTVTKADVKNKTIGRLIGGETYTIAEIKPPKGYKVIGEIKVEMSLVGEVSQKTGYSSTLVSIDNSNVKLNIEDEPTVVSFKKVVDDNDNTTLAGAKFELTPAETLAAGQPAFMYENGYTITGVENLDRTTNPNKISWTSTTDPAVFTQVLIADVWYYLTELGGNDRLYDHEVMSEPVKFKVNINGEMEFAEPQNLKTIPNNPDLDSAALDEQKTTMSIRNPYIKGSVILTKYWAQNTSDDPKSNTIAYAKKHNQELTYSNDDINADAPATILRGAVFTLYAITNNDASEKIKTPVYAVANADGTYSYASAGTTGATTMLTTYADGTLNVKGLPEGRYAFIESNAPAAYHIDDAPIYFEIHEDDKAKAQWDEEDATKKGTALDTRINAKISLAKYSNDAALTGAAFKVEYRLPGSNGAWAAIGYLTETKDDAGNGTGVYTMTQAAYPASVGGTNTAEGLWRGEYRITELNAPDQMLNKTDLETRNVITFAIGNVVDKTYTVKTGDELSGSATVSYKTGDSAFITINDRGVHDTPIPTKSVTVTKEWAGDNDNSLVNTFRPNSVKLQLYRTYVDAEGKEVEDTAFSSKPENTAEVTAGTDGKWTYTWGEDNDGNTLLPAYFNDPVGDTDGTYITRLYTYKMREVKDTTEYDFWTWYEEKDEQYAAPTGLANQTANTLDGDTTAKVTNTMTTQTLTIRKNLGGGSGEDEFKVRVKLFYPDGTSAGNTGYYADAYTVTHADTSTTEAVPETDEYWMTIKGNETISIHLPVGVTYEIEEQTDAGTVTGSSGLTYVPRYVSGTTGTMSETDASEAVLRNAVVKHMTLTKVGENDDPLTGAEYRVKYTPDSANGTNPWTVEAFEVSAVTETVNGEANVLIVKDFNPVTVIDFTPQGTYQIIETKAPDNYMTPYDGATHVLATVTVNQNDIMTIENNDTTLVTAVSVPEAKYGSIATATVKNEKTVVYIDKLNDIIGSTKTSNQTTLGGEGVQGVQLEIYKDSISTANKVYEWGTTGEAVRLTNGTLQEGVTYILHEASVPNDSGLYECADDISFTIYGTTIRKNAGGVNETVAQLSVNGSKTDSHINNNTLTMVNEVAVAPVTLHKTVGDDTTNLPGALFEVKKGETPVGVVVTTESGIRWHSIESAAIENGLVYNRSGMRITAFGDVKNDTADQIVLRKGEYTFTETYAPDHAYNEGKSFYAEVTDADYTEYKKQPDTYVVQVKETGKTDIVNPAFTATFKLYKYDAEHPKLEDNRVYADVGMAGVEFTLTRIAGTELNETVNLTGEKAENGVRVTSGENGLLSYIITKKGTYTLQESETLNGYKLSETVMTFTVTDAEQGQTLTYDAAEDNTKHVKVLEKADGTNTGETTSELGNERYHGEIILIKTDADTQERLNGVAYTLTRITPKDDKEYPAAVDAEGKPVEITVITGKTYTMADATPDQPKLAIESFTDSSTTKPGQVIITNLQWGTYKLVETTELPGYLRKDATNDAIEFTINSPSVDANGNVVPVEESQTNTKNQVTFHKQDSEPTNGTTYEALAGAVFEVHEGAEHSDSCEKAQFYNLNTPALTTANYVNNVTSDGNGSVTIYGLPTDTSKDDAVTYHLVETTAPLGYKLAAPKVFTIDRSGKVEIVNSDGTTTEMTNKTITMDDEPIVVTLQKLGEGDDALAGAVFELTDVCAAEKQCTHKLANGSTAGTSTEVDLADNLMKATITVAPAGTAIKAICIAGHTYQLTETKAPDGYECTAVVTFTVADDGTVTIDTGSACCAEVTDSSKISVSDEKIRLSLVKQDYDDELVKLAGVEFELKPVTGSTFANGETNPVTLTTINGDISFAIAPETRGVVVHDGIYTLTETSVGANYAYRLISAPITFRVKKDGTLEFVKKNDSDEWVTDTGTAWYSLAVNDSTKIIAKNEKIKLNVDKVDRAAYESNAAEQHLSGVTLTLTQTDNTTTYASLDTRTGWSKVNGKWTYTWTTEGEGFTIPEMYPGDYELVETAVPASYNLYRGKITFTVQADGTITDVQEINEKGYVVSPMTHFVAQFVPNVETTTPESTPGSISLIMKNAHYVQLQITKMGIGGNSAEKLANVEFRLTQDGTQNNPWSASTNSEGIVTFRGMLDEDTNTYPGLPDGTYTLTEVKTAAGYNLLSKSLQIFIDSNGEVYTLDDATGHLSRTAGSDILKLTIYNRKGFNLPATGTTTPQLPLWVLMGVAMLEIMALFAYTHSGKRRKQRGVKSE